jgi:hypothetical protein
MNDRFSRPSPATILAVTALVVAAVGTAVADSGPSAKPGVKKVVKQQVRKLAPGLHVASADTAGQADTAGRADTAGHADTADSAGHADTADAAGHADTATDATTLQGVAPDAFQRRVRWALVRQNGTIVAQSGGIRLSGHPSSPGGTYYLDFGAPTSGKAIMINGWSPDSVPPMTGATSPCGSAPDATVCNANGDPTGNPNDGNHVVVLTSAGTTQQNEAFYITLTP